MNEAAIDVVHAADKRRYELREGDTVIGAAHYKLEPGHVVFTHTTINTKYGGQGLGGRLVDFALSDVRDAGLRIVPVCPYVAAYLRRHHEFDDIVDQPGSDATTEPANEPAR
jgi:predicted GNAT family acetyltransferase